MTAPDPAWVEAGAKALGIDFVDPLAVEAVIAAVEPLIRREVLADLQAKVEAMRDQYQRYLVFAPAQWSRVDSLNGVLALIEEVDRG